MAFRSTQIGTAFAVAVTLWSLAASAELLNDDLELLFRCKLAIERPELRTPYAKLLLQIALYRREVAWGNVPPSATTATDTGLVADIQRTCALALGTQPAQTSVLTATLSSPEVEPIPEVEPMRSAETTRRDAEERRRQAEVEKDRFRKETASETERMAAERRAKAATSAKEAAERAARERQVAARRAPALPSSAMSGRATAPEVADLPPAPRPDQLEPWPPPRPTDYAVFADFVIKHPELKTVGDVDSRLRAELNAGGHYKLRYWGAPRGFALVVPLEAIDDQARPVARPMAAASSIGWGSIIEEIWNGIPALISGPIRRYRIVLFVLTDDESVRHPQAPMTPAIGDNWDVRGGFVLPKIDRTTNLTSDHIGAVFVYEFEKNKNGDLRLLDRSNLSAVQHIRSSNLTWLLK